MHEIIIMIYIILLYMHGQTFGHFSHMCLHHYPQLMLIPGLSNELFPPLLQCAWLPQACIPHVEVGKIDFKIPGMKDT